MAKKSTKETEEEKGPQEIRSSARKRRAERSLAHARTREKPTQSGLKAKTEAQESKSSRSKTGPIEVTAPSGPISGSPSLIQSNFGVKGNFELVVPLSTGGIAHYWRNNDDSDLPWYGPIIFGADLGGFDAVSLLQSNFGGKGNLELVAVDSGGLGLLHFWRESGPSFDWYGPNYITEPSSVPMFSGNPSMIQSSYGYRGNFDVVVPLAEGGLAHYWRDNDDPDLPWYGPFKFGSPTGVRYDALCLIQSNFGAPGHLELIARSGDQLAFFWRDISPEFRWNGPILLDKGTAGTPCMVQSKFGMKGNFELVVPLKSSGMGYYWRDNDDPDLPWHRPIMFGSILDKVDSVSFIQSNFGYPGNFELVAKADGQVAFFWRDCGPDLRWNGPYFSIPV